jgi:class 3 adenylate cyclase
VLADCRRQQLVVVRGKQQAAAFFNLTIKIGVGYGRCQELVVGNPQQSLEFVLTGTAVDEAAMAERQASAGDIIASAAVLRQAGLPAGSAFQKLETAVSPPCRSPHPQLVYLQ